MMTLPTLDHFTADILARLPAASGWEVQKFMVTSPVTLAAALEWTNQPETDALWFEFCWPPFPAMIDAIDFNGRRVIVRVHRIEAVETPYVANTAWAKVDDVIVVSPDMRERVLAAAPEITVTSRIHIILNGVDSARFTPNQSWNQFRLGWCGLMNLRKNPTLALHILWKLRQRDERYHLTLCGMGDEALASESFLHLAENLDLLRAITWDGRVSQADMPAWHASNGVLVHTSLHESFGYAIAEAALSGCDIAIASHPGADTIWPAETLFHTIDDAAALIQNARPNRWRDYVQHRFCLDHQITDISRLLQFNFQAALSQ
jgi:glycosyltransferase involved in cell wall biosynthesis